MRNILDKHCRKSQDKHFTFNNFFLKIVPFMIGGKYTKRNVWCVSIATMVMQTHHNVMLYAHCLSSLIVSILCVQRKLYEHELGEEGVI